MLHGKEMKIAVLLVVCWAHLSSGEVRRFKVFYTGTTGIQGIPGFVSIYYLNDEVMGYFDSNTKRFEAKQSWVTEKLGQEYAKQEENILMNWVQWFPPNLQIVMDRFNQTGGVHTFQFMYGCQWDDETQAIDGYDQFGYDGEDFLALDLKNLRYIGTSPQSHISQQKWNTDVGLLQFKKQYFTHQCIDWLKKYVEYGSSTLGRKVAPEVSLVQKDPEVACHATGFYPDAVMITWKKDGVEIDDDVDVGETLPNEDGTFQKRAVLTVSPEERTKATYTCEVTHKGDIFRPREPRTVLDTEPSPTGLIPGVVIGVILLVALVALAGFLLWKKRNSGFGPVNKEDDVSASSDETTPQKV